MRSHRARRPQRASRISILIAATALVASGAVATVSSAAATVRVQPNARGELDCNGFSKIQKAVRPTMVCMDPRTDVHYRFEDNGHYIGHDEPSVRFVSNAGGSGDDVTLNEVLGKDPAADPTVNSPGTDITHFFELSIAPWISMDICDPNSFPQITCTPRSDANAPSGRFPGGGAAFLELQFYPPGFAPFADSVSCDNTHWCSALNIDSLECTQNGNCNTNCEEPVNFAFIQTNGVPTGPPSPELTDAATFTPDAHTLLMNPGDNITIRVFDATISGGHALEIQEIDHTNGRSGYMIASAANGFMNTNMVDCTGTPFNFEPEYSTAAAGNFLPWGPGEYNINSQYEIGHFEPCSHVSGSGSTQIGSVTDTYNTNCEGAYESGADKGSALEPDDAPCYRKGDTHSGLAAPNEVTGCLVFFDAIGDLEYDGNPYRTDWPTGTSPGAFPATFRQQQPTSHGDTYPRIQFVTDMSATEAGCDLTSGSGCVMPPPGPGNFYPFFTLAEVGGTCVWEFGNVHNGNTFGGFAQYGSVNASSDGAFQSPVMHNPSC